MESVLDLQAMEELEVLDGHGGGGGGGGVSALSLALCDRSLASLLLC